MLYVGLHVHIWRVSGFGEQAHLLIDLPVLQVNPSGWRVSGLGGQANLLLDLPVLQVNPSGWRASGFGGQAHLLLIDGPGKQRWEHPPLLDEQPFWPVDN